MSDFKFKIGDLVTVHRAECYELIDDLLSVIGKAYKAKSKNAMRNILKDYV